MKERKLILAIKKLVAMVGKTNNAEYKGSPAGSILLIGGAYDSENDIIIATLAKAPPPLVAIPGGQEFQLYDRADFGDIPDDARIDITSL